MGILSYNYRLNYKPIVIHVINPNHLVFSMCLFKGIITCKLCVKRKKNHVLLSKKALDAPFYRNPSRSVASTVRQMREVFQPVIMRCTLVIHEFMWILWSLSWK